ncbi:hypothetical protein JOF56_005162 [Kibdelosporangium banguiense]|uniref:Uncharacterized protein n=1 Tax=Kibdelosporangium banguiense TaxID=1365924 RepID=A0ABS4TK31_9PSEU|nr:hypothetical protein [Kibdelosporangium banguiense]MBP2324777.1 hypothetical protein [Kibdelosporangium banguiense]
MDDGSSFGASFGRRGSPPSTPNARPSTSSTLTARFAAQFKLAEDLVADYSKHPGPTTNTVQELLGRPALTFAEWAHDNASVFSVTDLPQP